ncbi:hypothetical protein PoB_000884400 [Plakobranchus ocellatus]|uniref:Uncharacterized protein n=1 Tax=Plakobranchus ocellatus TaxID=259542 RepID=A0AAV3YJ81_9GAST|nr:hypothetical protein PoB_000884400 [Plakobranchus ocellatus]
MSVPDKVPDDDDDCVIRRHVLCPPFLLFKLHMKSTVPIVTGEIHPISSDYGSKTKAKFWRKVKINEPSPKPFRLENKSFQENIVQSRSFQMHLSTILVIFKILFV